MSMLLKHSDGSPDKVVDYDGQYTVEEWRALGRGEPTQTLTVPRSSRPAMTTEVAAMAEKLGPFKASHFPHQPTMSTSNDVHIILDKELRRDIDAIIQRLKEGTGEANSINIPTDNQRRSRERSLAITKLQEAVMWLGMDLKDINDKNPGAIENPYPHSKDPTNTVIDKTADGLKL